MTRREHARQLAPGSVVSGKYTIVARLGGGGMGDVYRAEHTLAGRVVALKLLRSDFAEDPDLVRRFFQEAQAVNRIRHPNIVDVLDAGLSDEGPYVVMECLEGTNVSDALARAKRFDLPTALSVMMPVLDALEAAHRAGIVHRDLKPENIFIAKDGIAKHGIAKHGIAGLGPATGDDARVKILDFGIAKVTDGDGGPDGRSRPKTHTGIIFGTPDYLSPEQASGDGVVDGRSDIFAAGIVLFELLTGRRPFEAKSAVATAYKIVHEAAPRLADCGVHVDPRVEEALEIALAKSQDGRFATAGTFADMLAPLVPEGSIRREALRAVVRARDTVPPTEPAGQTGAPPDAEARAMSTRISNPPPYAQTAPPPPRPSSAPSIPPVSPVAPTLAATDFGLGYPKAPPPRDRSSPAPPPVTPSWPPARTNSAIRTVTTPRRAAWSPRQLPQHVKASCHVRGSFARAVSRWIERAYGNEARERIFQVLAPDDADAFRRDSLNALVWYDIEPVDMFIEASTALLMAGQAGTWRMLACESFERDLGPIFRTTTARLLDAPTLLSRSITAWSRVFDFGVTRVIGGGGAGGRAIVKVEGFDAASLAVRYAVLGTMHGLLESSGVREPSLRVIAGESSFARDFEYEVTWKP